MFESDLGIFWEPVMQAWVIDSANALVVFFNWAYIATFWPIILISAIVLYCTNRNKYWYYRNVVLVSFVIGVVGFMLFPLGPPRMMALYFIDTIQVFGPSEYASREMVNYFNAFAAMPSLHFVWATWCVVALGPVLRRRWTRGLIAAYPVATLFAVVVTANHYWLDAAVGVVLLAAGYLVTNQVAARLRLPTTSPAGSV